MKKTTLGIPRVESRKNFRAIDFIRAHEATGHVTMRDHVSKMENAVNRVIQGDDRFAKPATSQNNYGYQSRPFCVDCTTPDDKGAQHAIIHTSDNRLVRHPFEYDETACVAKMCEGEPKATESTRVYAHRIEQLEGAIKARHEEIISCRVAAGTQIDASEKWEAGKPVSFIYVPGGDHTITAGFKKDETITCTIRVNEDTAKALQDSFDFMTATETQEPYGDEDHEGKKATLRFPAGKVKFKWGTLRGKEGVIVEGAEPTSYGAECANGKIYASWSGEFASDIAKKKLVCKKKHNTIPDGERGSKANPAEITDVNFVVGAMTNQPAFHKMPKITAKDAEALQAENEAEEEKKGIIEARDENGEIIKAGDYPGHPFRGNQYMAGEGEGSHHKASYKAHKASITADSKKSHNEAADKHETAAKAWEKEGNEEASDYHRTMSDFHKRTARKKKSTTKATDESEEARNSESAETQLATIFASNAKIKSEVDELLSANIPSIKHRKVLEEIFSQSGS